MKSYDSLTISVQNSLGNFVVILVKSKVEK